MGNCLVTKLKGVVDNSSLKKMSEIRFTVGMSDYPNNLNLRVKAQSGKTITIKVLDSNASFTMDDLGTVYTEVTLDSVGAHIIHFANIGKLYEVSLTSKYDTEIFEQGGVIRTPISDVMYAGFSTLRGGIDGVITLKDFLTLPNLVTIEQPYRVSNVSGNIADLADGRDWRFLDFQESLDVVGDISSIATADLRRAQFVNTGVTGSLENFVSAMLNAGHITYPFNGKACMQVDQLGSYVTFGGELHPECNSFGGLQFESASRILLYHTDSTYSITAGNFIIAKGATASEIAAWEAAGKTVTVIS